MKEHREKYPAEYSDSLRKHITDAGVSDEDFKKLDKEVAITNVFVRGDPYLTARWRVLEGIKLNAKEQNTDIMVKLNNEAVDNIHSDTIVSINKDIWDAVCKM